MDKYIKIDFYGAQLTYWLDEVDYIGSEKLGSQQEIHPASQEVLSDFSRRDVKTTEKSFLWRVWSKNNTVYILGSIHLAKKDLYPLDKKIEDAFSASDILAVEANLNTLDSAKIQKFIEQEIYPAGDTIEKHLSEKTHTLLKNRLTSLGFNIEQFNMYRPWFLAMRLIGLELVKLGFDPDYGIDIYFLKKSKGNKEISELETFESQVDLFNSLTDEEQELLLFSALLDLDILEEQMNELIEIWKSGDVSSMESMLRKGLLEYPEIAPVYNKILYKRNKNIVSKIENFLSTKDNYFVVVGAAHLVGEEGIIRILKQKGYSIQQL